FAGLAAQPNQDREALAACIRHPRPPLDAEILGQVTIPVLVVLGDRDFAGPADPLVEALPDARFVPLRGADHFATPKDFGLIDAAVGCLDAQIGPMAEDAQQRARRERLRTGFDRIAERYDATRVGYPDALVDAMLATAGVGPGDPVLEVGCGTGQLTRQLAER